MTRFFDDNLVVHTHIEKTAGSTLVRGFIREFGREHVCDIRSGKITKPKDMASEERRKVYLLTGHFHYATQDKHFERRPLYLACARPPLERYHSYYNFVRVRPAHPGYAAMRGKSFLQLVEDFLRSDRRRANAMARTITGLGKPTREQVIEHAENNYLIITPHQKVNDTLGVLLPLLGGARRRRKELHMNRGEGALVEELGSLASAFNEANALDGELYEYVWERYQTWLSDLGTRLHAASCVFS